MSSRYRGISPQQKEQLGNDIPRNMLPLAGTPVIDGDTVTFSANAQSTSNVAYWEKFKKYMIKCTVLNLTQGSIYLPYDGSGTSEVANTNGEYDFIYIPDSNEIMYIYSNNAVGSVTINSIQEVLEEEHKEVLNIDSRRGAIYDQYGNTITNTGVEVVRDGEIYVEKYNGSTSSLNLNNEFIGIGDISINIWIKPRSFGEGELGRIMDNGKVFFNFDGTNSRVQFYSSATISANSAINSINLNKFQMVTVTRTSSGITNFYIDGILSGTANQTSGTPEAGTTNLYIGNRSVGGRAYEGKMSKKAIYQGIISAEEISQLYTSTKHFYNK